MANVKSRYKIDVKGLEGYRVGDDGEIYRLPYTDKAEKKRRLLKVRFDDKGGKFNLNGKGYYPEEIDPYLIEDTEPIILVSNSSILNVSK